jgi:Putative transposase, YhgA-like
MTEHDSAYKNLFSHPRAVQDLLRGFVHEDWVALLDFDSLEKVNGTYVTDELRDRESDIVWRIRRHKGHTHEPQAWLYVYLLLEFQSTVDTYMAVRVLAYIALLYQDLIKSKQLQGGKLPAVFPLVLYNGQRPWSAARSVEELIEDGPEGLAVYRPRLRYFLLDEGRVPESELRGDNTVSSIVRLERCHDMESVEQLIGPLAKILQGPDNAEFMRAMTLWVNEQVIKPIVPSDQPKRALQTLEEVKNMLAEEVKNMLAENMKAWAEGQRLLGAQQGMQQGEELGEKRGLKQGQVRSLKQILALRFKASLLPSELEDQIQAASPEQIEQWIQYSLEESSLEAVFKAH